MVLWLLFCKNICLESISILHQNCSKNIPLSNRTGNNTMPTRELTQNNTYTQKFTFFTTFFAKKSYLITTIQFKLVAGIICIYGPILLYFKNFLIYLSKYVKSVVTHFQFTTKMRTPHHSKCKKVTE